MRSVATRLRTHPLPRGGTDPIQVDDEAGEFSFFAFYLNRAAEVANDAEADTQTQPSAARFAARREKGIEYFAEIFASDPDAVVVKLYANSFAGTACADSEYFSFVGIGRLRLQSLMRITDHVNHDLPEA